MNNKAEWINGNVNWFIFDWNFQLNTATIFVKFFFYHKLKNKIYIKIFNLNLVE